MPFSHKYPDRSIYTQSALMFMHMILHMRKELEYYKDHFNRMEKQVPKEDREFFHKELDRLILEHERVDTEKHIINEEE